MPDRKNPATRHRSFDGPPLQLGPPVGARPRLATLDSDGHPSAIYRTYVALTHLGSEILRRVLPNQLVFLPMESMGQLEYSTLLAGVLQLAPDEVHRTVAGSRENARQAAPDTWRLRLCAGRVSPGCETTGLQGGDSRPASRLERSGRPSLGQGPRHISLAPDQLERLCALVSDANHRIPEAWAPIGLPGYSFESGSI